MTESAPVESLESGCVRQTNKGRGAYELMSPFVEARDAAVFEYGAIHRGARNWEKGCPFSRCVQSMKRHLVEFLQREPNEEQDDNLASIRFWAGALMHYEEMIKRGLLPADLDDLPHYEYLDVPDSPMAGVLQESLDRKAGFPIAPLIHVQGIGLCTPDAIEKAAVELSQVCLQEGIITECCREDAIGGRGYWKVDWSSGIWSEQMSSIRFIELLTKARSIPTKNRPEIQPVPWAKEKPASPSEQLRIYIAGPITSKSYAGLAANLEAGRNLCKQLKARGHLVFCPMVYDDHGLSYEDVLELDFSIIDTWATALFFIAPSPGADRELDFALKIGLPVYRHMSEIPDITKKPD